MKSSTKIPVRGYHIDHLGHVNHARFLELLEEARWRYLEENRLLEPLHRLRRVHVVAEIQIRYRKSAYLGDVLRVDTEIASRSDRSFVVRQAVLNCETQKQLAVAKTTNVFVDEHGKPQSIDETILGLWADLAEAPRYESHHRKQMS